MSDVGTRERDERRHWAPMGDADEPEPRGVRCKRRYRVPGTGGSSSWQQCPGVVGEDHRCSVCGMPPRDYQNEGTR